MVARLAAFALLGCAAFAWTPPWLDRPGTAALGFAFAALTVGRGAVASRPTLPRPKPPAIFDGRPLDRVPSHLEKALAGYGLGREVDDDAA